MLGGHSGRETPGNIPNPVVKPSSDSVCTALLCGKTETLPEHLTLPDSLRIMQE